MNVDTLLLISGGGLVAVGLYGWYNWNKQFRAPKKTKLDDNFAYTGTVERTFSYPPTKSNQAKAQEAPPPAATPSEPAKPKRKYNRKPKPDATAAEAPKSAWPFPTQPPKNLNGAASDGPHES